MKNEITFFRWSERREWFYVSRNILDSVRGHWNPIWSAIIQIKIQKTKKRKPMTQPYRVVDSTSVTSTSFVHCQKRIPFSWKCTCYYTHTLLHCLLWGSKNKCAIESGDLGGIFLLRKNIAFESAKCICVLSSKVLRNACGQRWFLAHEKAS